MTTTEKITNASGRDATGIPPIQCPSWCTDPGHVADTFRADQNCYSSDAYVTASLDEVEINKYGGVCESRIGAMAYRGFNKYPVVLIHVEGFRGGLDAEIRLTADEAKQLAQYMLAAADMIEGDPETGRSHFLADSATRSYRTQPLNLFPLGPSSSGVAGRLGNSWS